MFHIIDYSEIAYELLKRPFAPERDGKLVLLKHNDENYIVLAPLEFCRLHAQIVDRFCQLRKLPTRVAGARVDPISESWIASGGCCFEASDRRRTLSVFGVSEAYGGLELTNLRHVLQTSDFFGGYTVSNR